ncbi:hypothetical protein PINS_up009901 [Pythium insidiosum]|nr:hypothetical protein PINS_up009901 [Pythium insidiosum]
MDDLFVLHIPIDDNAPERSALWRWQQIHCEGVRPSARELHVACWLPQAPPRVCFLGGRGRDRDGALCDDVAVLDVERWTWTLQSRPASSVLSWWQRCAHVAGVVDRQLVSVGGWDGAEISSECYALPLSDAQQSEKTSEVATATARVVEDDEHEQRNQARLGRFGHCGCVVATAASATKEPEAQQEEKEDDAAMHATALLVFGGMTADDDLQDLVVIAPADVVAL